MQVQHSTDEDPVDAGIKFIKHIQFDKSNRFLVGHGKNKVFILDLKSKTK